MNSTHKTESRQRALPRVAETMSVADSPPMLAGREEASERMKAAMARRRSLLIWGPAGSGKTALANWVMESMPKCDRQNCIYVSGAATARQLAGQLVRGLYLASNVLLREKVRKDGAAEPSLNRWLRDQSAVRLKGLLYAAAQQRAYWFFLDHCPPASSTVARLIKEVIWRANTPIYLLARGCSHEEIGHAWSIYYTKEYHLPLGPLPEPVARELLESYIHRFHLDSLNLEGFRENVLRLSHHLPGAIERMCELAADPRYHYGDQVKITLIHVDCLIGDDPYHKHSSRGYFS